MSVNERYKKALKDEKVIISLRDFDRMVNNADCMRWLKAFYIHFQDGKVVEFKQEDQVQIQTTFSFDD
jgi:hypothetical protein